MLKRSYRPKFLHYYREANTLMVQQIFTDETWFERMTPEDFRALTPLTYAHINPYGKFELDMQQRLPLDAA
jgi:hypothetical protein